MAAKKSSAYADGLTSIASILQKYFRANGHPEFVCPRQYIRQWQKPTALRPVGFPSPTDGNRFLVSDCIAWVFTNIVSKGITDDEDANLFERANKAVAKNKILKWEDFDLDVSIKRGKQISVDLIKNNIGGIGARISGHYDKLIEDREGLRGIVRSCGIQSGISEEQIHALDSAL